MAESFEIIKKRIEVYQSSGLPERAIDLLCWYLDLERTDSNAWSLLTEVVEEEGGSRRVLELCKQILTEHPEHEEAKRMHDSLVGSEAPEGEEEDPALAKTMPPLLALQETLPEETPSEEINISVGDPEWEEEETALFQRKKPLEPYGEIVEVSAEDPWEASLHETTKADWMPGVPDLGTAATPTHARFVCTAMAWPSVLDQTCLIFRGDNGEVEPEVADQMETISLAEDKAVYAQGDVGQILYSVDAGAVYVVRYRDGFQQFGIIGEGAFFGEVGTIAGMPNTAGVITKDQSILRVLNRDKMQGEGLDKLTRSLKSWYQEAALGLCPLFQHCDDQDLGVLEHNTHWMTSAPGDNLAEQGEPGDLRMIVMGVARVTRAQNGTVRAFGFVTTGDLVGASDPSPVTVTAETVVSSISIDRDVLVELPEEARQSLDEHIAVCQEVLDHEEQALHPED